MVKSARLLSESSRNRAQGFESLPLHQSTLLTQLRLVSPVPKGKNIIYFEVIQSRLPEEAKPDEAESLDRSNRRWAE